MPAYCQPAAYAAFECELPRIETTSGLFRAAFAIARHERPAANVDEAETTIAELADTVRRRVRSDNAEAKLAHLHDVLFDVVGFAGNVTDYYNPANSFLPDVLKTHRGLPITLTTTRKGTRLTGALSEFRFKSTKMVLPMSSTPLKGAVSRVPSAAK